MQILDWLVMCGTIALITIYGIKKTRGSSDTSEYLLSRKMKWYTVGLSVMATQASAITFLSTPGQAYSDGMRFVQFYFGLPLAMIVLSVTIVPIFHRLKVFTAYEYLEGRFDLKTRSLSVLLFLIQRGLAAGLTIYAPALILSAVLGWDIFWINLGIGVVVTIYTVSGGSAAVSITQKYQMAVIFIGMLIAGILVFYLLPGNTDFLTAVKIAGKAGRLNVIDTSFDPNNKYTLWSGLLGGFFLSLSYFGTDQSQVQRYLSGSSVAQSRLGLLMNGFIKIPMQFLILFVGIGVFVFYQFNMPPVFFNKTEVAKIYAAPEAEEFKKLEEAHKQTFSINREKASALSDALAGGNESRITAAETDWKAARTESEKIRNEALELIHRNNKRLGDVKSNDTNYVFLTFVIENFPAGLVGLLLAVILSASMSSTSSELNALASATVIDVYKRSVKPGKDEKHYLQASKIITVLWGAYAVLLAEFANSLSNNLIEAVNILGSLFYGTVLGIFLVAFYVKRVGGNAVFYAALAAESSVLSLWYFKEEISAFTANNFGFPVEISYLWYNLIGCVLVVFISLILQIFIKKHR